jgi:hypothetical protein
VDPTGKSWLPHLALKATLMLTSGSMMDTLELWLLSFCTMSSTTRSIRKSEPPFPDPFSEAHSYLSRTGIQSLKRIWRLPSLTLAPTSIANSWFGSFLPPTLSMETLLTLGPLSCSLYLLRDHSCGSFDHRARPKVNCLQYR